MCRGRENAASFLWVQPKINSGRAAASEIGSEREGDRGGVIVNMANKLISWEMLLAFNLRDQITELCLCTGRLCMLYIYIWAEPINNKSNKLFSCTVRQSGCSSVCVALSLSTMPQCLPHLDGSCCNNSHSTLDSRLHQTRCARAVRVERLAVHLLRGVPRRPVVRLPPLPAQSTDLSRQPVWLLACPFMCLVPLSHPAALNLCRGSAWLSLAWLGFYGH